MFIQALIAGLLLAQPGTDDAKPTSRVINPDAFRSISPLRDSAVRRLLNLTEDQENLIDNLQKEWLTDFERFSQLTPQQRSQESPALKESLKRFEGHARESLTESQRDRLNRLTVLSHFDRGVLQRVRSEAVQRELELTDNQKQSDEKAYEQWLADGETMLLKEEPRNLPRDERPSKLVAIRTALDANARDLLMKVLSKTQWTRLEQLELQADCVGEGLVVFNRPEIAEALKMTPEQRQQIKEMADELPGDYVEKFRAARSGYEKCLELLTPRQRELWTQRLGKPDVGNERLYPAGM